MIQLWKRHKDKMAIGGLLFLVVYSMSYWLSDTFAQVLLKIGSPYVNQDAQPVSYINLAFTVLVLTVFLEVGLLIRKKDIRKKLAVAGSGLLIAIVCAVGFFIHSQWLVSGISQGEVAEHSFYTLSDEQLNEDFDEDETCKIIHLCGNLKPVSKEEQRELEQSFRKNGYSDKAVILYLSYKVSCGKNLDVDICIDNNKIFIEKGTDKDGQNVIVFMKDNGLTKYFQ